MIMITFTVTHWRIDPTTYDQTVIGEYVSDASTIAGALLEAREELHGALCVPFDYLRARPCRPIVIP